MIDYHYGPSAAERGKARQRRLKLRDKAIRWLAIVLIAAGVLLIAIVIVVGILSPHLGK